MTGFNEVPHAEIKSKLDAEKAAKKRKKSKKSSASREAKPSWTSIRRTHLASHFGIGETLSENV